jgi:transposase
LRASEQDEERVQAARAAHRRALGAVAPQNLVFVDESGVNLSYTRLYARAPKGRRALGQAPRNWGKNVTIFGALGLEGLLASLHVTGSTDREVFLPYVEKVLAPALWPGAVVVLDNLSAHKGRGVAERIEACGARLVYLPPYSPDLNPIEQAWSKLKTFLRQAAARTYDALAQAIGDGLQTLSPQDAQGWFKHCGYAG